jgi:peroxiredoxin
MKVGKRQDRTIQPTPTKQPAKSTPQKQPKRTQKKQKSNNSIIIISSLLFVVVVALVVVISVSSGKNSEPKPKPNTTETKDFTLADTNGKTHKLSEYSGKPVILDFSASWCNPCRAQMPAIKKLYEEFKDKVQFFTVDHIRGSETAERATEFKAEEGIEWPMLLDKTGDVYSNYDISGIPNIVLLDKNGIIYHQQSGNKGDLMYTDFKDMLNRLFAGE